MMLETTVGVPMDARILRNYFQTLIGLFFKILPLRESNESTLSTYLQSLQVELLGAKGLISAILYDAHFMTLVSILQYLIDHPEMTIRQVRREVFRAISVCNKLKAEYSSLCEMGGEE